jgi:cytochrome c553
MIIGVPNFSSGAPVIPGFERFYADEKSNAADGGRLLLGELNCISCHKAADVKVSTKQAPILTNVAARVKPEFLRAFIADPHGTKPGTTMPDLFAGVPAAERAKQVDALVHFLASLTEGEPAQAFANIGAAKRGMTAFHQVGCAVCHGERKEGAKPAGGSVPLPDLSKKYTLPSLAEFIADPLHIRPSGRMPSLNLTGSEARDIAAFLLPDVPEKAGLAYYYYEGSWQSMPDFSKLQPKATGGVEKIDVAPRKRDEQFGLRFDGSLPIEKEGDYKFHVSSDDGSQILIDGKVVADNNGIHGHQTKSGTIKLKPGSYHVSVVYFEQSGEQSLSAEWEGPGIARQELSNAIVAAQPETEFPSLKLQPDPQLAQQGRQLFAKLGCASCHEAKSGGQNVAPSAAVPTLAGLNTAKGCLAEKPAAGTADFQLSARQRKALSSAVAANNLEKPLDAKSHIAATMTQMNCYACHERGGKGGVEEAQAKLFQGTQPEMGDEGRLPPHLNGTGDKLTDEWLASILADGAKDRPYMHTRMPKFGKDNVGHLAKSFISLDRKTSVAKVNLDAKDARRAGWKMSGNKAFNCISCHTFGHFKATGVQSIDLTIMSKRLREDWFKRYVRDPQAYRPGTRMPSSWAKDQPKSLLTNVLDGDSDRQIAAMWHYLTLGKKAPPPEGLVRPTLELIPTYEAIIYRNFIQGAGPRAIGVGYPEGVHLAFDANNLRLALLWKGRFIDAKKHWVGRGQGFQPPAGEKVLSMPNAVSFAALANKDAPWPSQKARELGYQFRGYRLSPDQRPTFLYRVGKFDVEDFPETIETPTKTTIARRFTITAKGEAKGQLFYRAATAAKIEKLEDGWFRVDDNLNMRLVLANGDAPILRTVGANKELLAPINAKAGAVKLSQEYDW